MMSDRVIEFRPKRKGNYKPGPGRPLGSKNRAVIAREKAAEEAAKRLGEALPEDMIPFTGSARAFLRTVYSDPRIPLPMRIVAATTIAKTEQSDDGPQLTQEQRRRRINELLSKLTSPAEIETAPMAPQAETAEVRT